ncbi:cell division protein FtsW (lipid II flippase) [Paenibacillus sp. V4I3]|uniref:FtsW/RodA/SpoVE family cell cycle protein n=1 Tax=Paenibacillus sp. V4I3 TaxID=3042305 RepID=UPI002784E344|nr:FtsW/RodA/SpoVE family cell cycle protein [Paenibacillus sp. V4I3]MDQ0878806.1 cell division protein FtsW (lipid II flippase) [Paenibacillus sp. V4I3]
MNPIRYQEDVKEFLKQVCSHIRAKEVHHEVQMELEGHLQDIIEEKLDRGIALNTAIKEAITQMGAPELIGAQFHKVHRPRTDWKLLGLLSFFILFGLVAVFTAQASLVQHLGFSSIGLKQVIYVCVGGLLMLGIRLFNYQKLASYSWALYIGTLILLVYSIATGYRINGMDGYLQLGRFVVNVVSISPYLFLLSLAGIWTDKPTNKLTESWIKSIARSLWLNLGVLLIPCVIFLKVHSLTDFILFFLGSASVLLTLKKRRSILITHVSSIFGSAIFYLLTSRHRSNSLDRWMAFLKPKEDTQGFNYVLTQSKEAIASASWWGHGYGTPLPTLPELHSNMMFAFLIYCFGWIAGILIFLMVILFIFHSLQISGKIRDTYGKALLSGLLTLFVIQFIWPMLMSFGWAPLSAFSLPFVSYNGTLVIFQFAAIGLILSVYRRKDLLGVQTNRQTQ